MAPPTAPRSHATARRVAACAAALVAAGSRLYATEPAFAWLGPSPSASQALQRGARGLSWGGAQKSIGLRRRPAARPSGERQGGVAVSAGFTPGPISISIFTLATLTYGYRRLMEWFRTPKRTYGEGSVGASYDEWTRDGVLEHYWGEHIHMGSYTPMDKQKGYRKDDPFLLALLRATLRPLENFKKAKITFSEEMIEFSKATAPKKILDVGCGIGGTSRILAKKFPDAEVTGITLSPEQVERATQLAKDAGLTNVKFQVMNALAMEFQDNTFDLVWGCESGEHMPDKKKYIEEMSRVLAPKGRLAVATWCERDPTPPFSRQERADLDFVYAEWSHPYFISLNKYKEHMEGTNLLEEVETQDWTEQTLPSWRHSIWVGVWSPWYWLKQSIQRPIAFPGFLREVYTLEKYHQGMKSGLLVYGMMRAAKK